MRLSIGFETRRGRARRLGILAAALLVAAFPAAAQTPDPLPAGEADADGWRAYPAFNEVTAVARGLGRIWAGTPGGVFSYDPASGEVERTTVVDGLRGGDLQALAVDERRGLVWAGYADGTLDRLTVETGDVRSFLDLSRNVQFVSRGVRRLIVRGDSLYAATDFGVVVFDVARGEVRNTYARLGSLLPATPVNDILFAPVPAGAPGAGRAGIWLATEAGVVRASADGPLQSPTAWTVEAGFGHRALSLAQFGGTIYAGGGPAGAADLYRRDAAGAYRRQLSVNEDIRDLVADGDGLTAGSDRLLARSAARVFAVAPGAPTTVYSPGRAGALSGLTVGPDGRRWAGDAGLGLFALPDRPDDGTAVAFGVVDAVVPAGPFANEIVDLDVARDGTLWAVTARVDAAQSSAVNRLDGDTDEWTALLTRDDPERLGQADLQSVTVGPDGTVYVGTGGDGLVVIAPNGDVQRYDETNSSLRSADPQNASFVSISGIAFERDRRWIANREAPLPLHLFGKDGTFAGLPFVDGTFGGQGRWTVAVDQVGQKWLTVGTAGLLVWDTGADPASPADDRVRQYRGAGEGQTGLPGAEVRDVVVDGMGTVWIGTARGLATISASATRSVFSADAGLALPQFTLTPTNADGRPDFFLRDVFVNDLDVDPAGRVWVATTSGAYLVVPAPPPATGYVLARTLDAATSPLPTDVVNRIAVRPGDGRVFLATERGLFSVGGDATAAVAASTELRASPSPFRPADTPGGVVVSGLASARSTVRVLTLAGERVYQADVAGGSFRWDGRDDRTGEVVSSGVYLVTAVDEVGASVVGKIAVIR